MLKKDEKIYVAGHNGMVGSALWNLLESEGYYNLVGISSTDLDLRDQNLVEEFISDQKPKVIVDAAAKGRRYTS